MDVKQFTETYCYKCGTQRCEGIHTIWFDGCQHKGELEYPVTPEMYDCGYTDEIGGIHACGIGHNPMGLFCGECTRTSCMGCKNAYKINKDD